MARGVPSHVAGALQILIFLGSKALGTRLEQPHTQEAELPSGSTRQCTVSPHGLGGVSVQLYVNEVGQSEFSLVTTKDQKVSQVESTLGPSSSRCRPHPDLLFYT